MARIVLNGIEVNTQQWNEGAEKTIVLLHGFTGSMKTWQHVVHQLPASIHVVAVDLIGHGQTSAPKELQPYLMDAHIDLLEQLFERLQLKQFTLLGYSMGGRVALSYAIRYPHRISALILESASPGLAQSEERMARKLADDTLAKKIEVNGITAFVNKWESIPLFATQKGLSQEIQQEIRAERLAQTTKGLANSLRGMGTGMMPSLWHKLHELNIRVTLITGSLDLKFEQLAVKMLDHLQDAAHISVNGAGHAIHVENPVEFATIVKERLN